MAAPSGLMGAAIGPPLGLCTCSYLVIASSGLYGSASTILVDYLLGDCATTITRIVDG